MFSKKNSQIIEADERRESDHNHQVQTKNMMDRKLELSELGERKFLEDLEDVKVIRSCSQSLTAKYADVMSRSHKRLVRAPRVVGLSPSNSRSL